MADIQEFEEFRIGIVSPDRIRAWSNGEVKKPETINYRTLKPERDGLFCEKIFGPTKDWECYCGKYKKVRFKGIICEKCGVEITRARVRRERMGHIELAAPVAHIWYFKGIPSKMGYLLDMSPKDLEKVLYFASHIVIRIDEEKRAANIDALKEELDREIDALNKTADEQIAAAEAEAAERRAEFEVLLKPEDGEDKKAISAAKAENKGVKKDIETVDKALEKRKKEIEASATHRYQEINGVYAFFKDMKSGQLAEFEDIFSKLFKKRNVNNEQLYWELEDRYGAYFEGGIGAEAVRELLRDIDLDKEQTELKSLIKGDGEKEAAKGQKRQKAIKRLKVVGAFRGSENNPEDMILETVPVIPPDLRPMVPLDGGRYATSDLNDLYRRVINRNNRLKRLLDLGAPKIIVNNEKRMLQEAVDTLFDNGRRGRPITGAGNRPLKSLADLLKGKQGRFRQNLLGKRVDYSGRSVIVVGPSLKFYQCGLPKQIALELFKPFVMKRLVDKGLAPNIKGVKKLVERANPVVWDVLEEVIKDQVVLLNRAPTLHRLGIQAFEPVLVEGKAIQIHPLVCTAFNADFDGDQMAVHLPLSAEAQAEARLLMLSAHNVLSPANGKPIATPTQDMVLGCYYLTEIRDGLLGEGKVFGSPQEAMMAEDFGEIDLRAKVTVRIKGERIETSVGRVIFNSVMPEGFRFVNQVVSKGDISNLVTECVEAYGMKDIVSLLDGIKNLGFKYATRAGTTIALDDIKVPKNKWKILEEPEAAVAKTEQQFRRGLMTEGERHQRVVNIWNDATDKVAKAMEEEFELDPDNPVYLMATSGARGNLKQVRQLAGMRGLVVNPKGDIIDRPIKTNFREGMTVLEYFLSTHGGRKGLADTALRTADAGYLTRRLVDVVQDTIVREEDCGTVEYVTLPVTTSEGDPNESLLSRITINDVKEPKGKKVILAAGEAIRHADLEAFVQAGVVEISVRSVVTCATRHGVCQQCYGLSLATGRLVDIGEAVGIIAAQSIGEPGTQLTLRTFHTGGVAAGGDITQGLPRVVELFEARKPKGQAILAEIDGKVTVSIDKEEDEVVVTITGAKKGSAKAEEKTYKIHSRSILRVADGDVIEHGDRITAGSIYPPDLVAIKDSRATQQYLVDGVQEVYRSQGVDIHDKHIELITRQMLTKVFISAAGDTDFLPGQYINSYEMAVENKRVVDEGGKEAVFRQVILGITKSSLETDSFLSAASFQETTRILTDAAVAGKSDPLLGLKENVIIGKLIPAGTGLKRYSDVTVMPASDEV